MSKAKGDIDISLESFSVTGDKYSGIVAQENMYYNVNIFK